jgi:hypothetical protein
MSRKSVFEKTNPIFVGVKWRKLLFERILWQYTVPRGTKKQSQFKANLNSPHTLQISGKMPAIFAGSL